MAGDSLTTAGGDVWFYGPKVHRAADGSIFGACGPAASAQRFKRFMVEGGEWPALADEFCALVLTVDGNAFWIDKDNERVPMALPAAVGSGDNFAIGAMLAGASPLDAVKIATTRDTRSGGDVAVIAR